MFEHVSASVLLDVFIHDMTHSPHAVHHHHHHHHSDEIEDEVEDVDVKNIKHNNSSSNGMCVPVCASVCV